MPRCRQPTNAATDQLSHAGDPVAALATLGPLTKTLQTYTIYEQRRRRAADAIETKLTTLIQEHVDRMKKDIPEAAKMAKAFKAKGKPFNPPDFGFVCSAEDIEQFLEGQELARDYQNAANQPQSTGRDHIRKFEEACEALDKQSKS
jgi:hypothetical protein